MEFNRSDSKKGAINRFGRLCREGFLPAVRLLFNPRTVAQLPRLLTEGMGPVRRMFIQAHNAREIRKLVAEGVPITFVTSFARSGNTWMRHLLSDVFLQNGGVETSTELSTHPNEIIADFYCNLIATRNKAVRTPGVLVKTHDLFDDLRLKFWGSEGGNDLSFQRCRHLYLYRSPEDSLVSLYHLHLREKYVKGGIGADIDAFCREGLANWLAHVSSYLQAAEKGAPIFFISYEHLLQDPSGVLAEVLRWLGAPFTLPMVKQAASNMEFEKLKNVDARALGDRPSAFRYGRKGGGAIELQPATIDFIRDAAAPLMARADSCAGRPPLFVDRSPVPSQGLSESELRQAPAGAALSSSKVA